MAKQIASTGPDILSELLSVVRDPTGAKGFDQLKQRNPVRISMDPDDPNTAMMTSADGSVTRGVLTVRGKFFPYKRAAVPE